MIMGQLHTELAKEAIDYKVYPDYKTVYEPRKDEEVEVVSCQYFTTSVLNLDKPFTKDLSGLDSFLVVMCTSGSGTVSLASEAPTPEGKVSGKLTLPGTSPSGFPGSHCGRCPLELDTYSGGIAP